MKLSLERLSARMRQGETIPLRDTAGVVLMLSIPSILEQIVVTAMEYIDAAMVGHIGAEATAAIGIVSSSTWLLHGILVGLYNAFSIQIAQYLGADRQQDARGVLRQAMLFNLAAGLAAAAFGIGISGHLPGWLGADVSLQANASAYFAIWSAALPFTMAMGMYTSMLRASGDALTPGLISVLVCVLDVSVQLLPHQPHPDAVGHHRLGCRAGRARRSPGHRPGHCGGRPAGSLAILLLAKRPSLHPEARFVEDHPRLSSGTCGKVGGAVWPPSARPSLSAQVLPGAYRLPAWARWPLRPTVWAVSAEGLCYMAGYGIQSAAVTLIGQAVGANRKDMAKRFAWLCTRSWHGGHGPFRRWPVRSLPPALMSLFHHRCGCHRSGCSGFAHRSLGRAHVRCLHRGQRCHAGCGRQHLLFCVEHIQHVVHPADTGVPAGSPAGP